MAWGHSSRRSRAEGRRLDMGGAGRPTVPRLYGALPTQISCICEWCKRLIVNGPLMTHPFLLLLSLPLLRIPVTHPTSHPTQRFDVGEVRRGQGSAAGGERDFVHLRQPMGRPAVVVSYLGGSVMGPIDKFCFCQPPPHQRCLPHCHTPTAAERPIVIIHHLTTRHAPGAALPNNHKGRDGSARRCPSVDTKRLI